MLNNSFKQQIDQVLKEHPSLSFNSQRGMFFGKLIVDHNDNDSYDVEILIYKFPLLFPIVWETGERIPRKADRHVYSIPGNCCFTTAAKEQILLKKHIHTLIDFINIIAIPYFQNNSFYEINSRYLFGEYSHGSEGTIEAYKEILGINDVKLVEKLLLDYLIGKSYIVNQVCYCSSGKLLKACHISNYNDLNLLDINLVKQDLNSMFLHSKIKHAN
jgi:hypothetical protein